MSVRNCSTHPKPCLYHRQKYKKNSKAHTTPSMSSHDDNLPFNSPLGCLNHCTGLISFFPLKHHLLSDFPPQLKSFPSISSILLCSQSDSLAGSPHPRVISLACILRLLLYPQTEVKRSQSSISQA